MLCQLSIRSYNPAHSSLQVIFAEFCPKGVFMIESVQFKNFRVLHNATLPLGRFTLIVGPNGSGKSTALQGLQASKNVGNYNFHLLSTHGASADVVEVVLNWGAPNPEVVTRTRWFPNGDRNQDYSGPGGVSEEQRMTLQRKLERIRVYSLDAKEIAAPVQISPGAELQQNGSQLASVLDNIQGQEPERFDALNNALGQIMPEFDRILLETASVGQKAFALRTRKGHHKVEARDISHGAILALAILTLAYLPVPPSVVCLEEPDRGIHPRLLREVQNVLYRLSYPESYGENRDPVQVIATTHSPFLLDLYRDHPEEVVIAEKTEHGGRFDRLSDQPDLDEILRDSHLGEIWYTGILGGVPAQT